MTVTTITIDMDKKCAECGKPGAVDNGLCMNCTTRALEGQTMRSVRGKAVQASILERLAGVRESGDLSHDPKNSTEGTTMAKSGFAKDQLKSFINRIERLEEERAALSADIREVYSEAKGTGFDTKVMRQVIRMRKLDKADFQEQEAMLDLYLTAMDMR